MTQWLTMLSAVLAIFAIIGLGAVGRRVQWLTDEADRTLLKLTINILFPALILDKTLGQPALRDISNLTLAPVVGFITVVGGFIVGRVVARVLAGPARLLDVRQQRTFALCIGLYNYGYVPIPLAQQLFGEDTLAVLFIHNLGVEIALWTVGILLISGHVGRQWYRSIINPVSITIVLALLLNFAGLHDQLPGFLRRAFEMLGASAIPLALVLIGATIHDVFSEARIAQGARVIALASLLRLGILPALFLTLAYFIPATVQLKAVITLEAAMPSAVFPIVLARHYGGHPPTAVRIVLGTALLSLVTMPLWLWAGMWLLGL
jgi:malate permease and related proteins